MARELTKAHEEFQDKEFVQLAEYTPTLEKNSKSPKIPLLYEKSEEQGYVPDAETIRDLAELKPRNTDSEHQIGVKVAKQLLGAGVVLNKDKTFSLDERLKPAHSKRVSKKPLNFPGVIPTPKI